MKIGLEDTWHGKRVVDLTCDERLEMLEWLRVNRHATNFVYVEGTTDNEEEQPDARVNNVVLNIESGAEILVRNNEVFVNGKSVKGMKFGEEVAVTVKIEGSAGDVMVQNGNLHISGGCDDVRVERGNIAADTVHGDVRASFGNVRCSNIVGDVDVQFGSFIK